MSYSYCIIEEQEGKTRQEKWQHILLFLNNSFKWAFIYEHKIIFKENVFLFSLSVLNTASFQQFKGPSSFPTLSCWLLLAFLCSSWRALLDSFAAKAPSMCGKLCLYFKVTLNSILKSGRSKSSWGVFKNTLWIQMVICHILRSTNVVNASRLIHKCIKPTLRHKDKYSSNTVNMQIA